MNRARPVKICATIEARMTSTRLPGKVLFDIVGKPTLLHIIERLKRSKYLNDVIVATTTNPSDDPVAELCALWGCSCYRGSEDDVLDRVLSAAKAFNADIIVEITGDCPFIDWRHVDHMIDFYFGGQYDYVSNTIQRTFPDGFDVQVFSTNVLDLASRSTQSKVDREHVSLYIYSHPEIFRLGNWIAPKSLYHPELAVTLDYPEDYMLITHLYSQLYAVDQDFSAEHVVNYLLAHPEISAWVSAAKRNNPFEEKDCELN